MQKNFLKKILIAFFCFSFACAKPPVIDPYVLSNLPNIQILEKQDDQFCKSLNLTFEKEDNLTNKLYWHCRLSAAKYRLYTDTRSPMRAKHNSEISDLIGKISLKIANSSESVLLRENKKMDNRQHKQCLIMGYVIDTEDQAKIDEYFSCRKALIGDQTLFPPFGNTQYLKYPNDSYNIGFVIDQQIDRGIKLYNAAKEKYPTCVKFNLNSENFKRCTKAQDRSRQCFSEVDQKRFRKEGEEKTVCQKQAYIRFSDNFLKEEDSRKREIEKMNANSDFYNQQSFASIGINVTQFDSDEERVKKAQEEYQKKIDDINSKNHLYNKFELTRLRQKYIFSCQEAAEERVEKYINGVKEYCESLTNFDFIGENP